MPGKTSAKPKPRGPGRLSAEATAELEARVLDAAETVFLTQGYDRATMDAVATVAGATRKTIYARYANKEAIFAAVIDRMLEESADGPSVAAPDHKDPRAALLKLAQDLIAIAETPRTAGLSRLIFAEGHQSPELVQLSDALYLRALGGVRDLLTALHGAGRLPAMPDIATASTLFMEMTVSTARSRAILGDRLPRKRLTALTEAAVDMFLRGCGFRA